MKATLLAPSLVLLLACGSANKAPGGSGGATDPAPTAGGDPAGDTTQQITEHGVIIDYFTKRPVAGLTVSDNGASTTTNTLGQWSLTVPSGAVLQPTIAGPSYSSVLYPDSTPVGSDVDFSTELMPNHSSFMLEQGLLDNFDTSQALVHVVVRPTGACAGVEGGTIQVVSPPGASVTYFSAAGIPTTSLTSIQPQDGDRPVAVVYNVSPGADVQIAVNHPSCAMVPFPATYSGRTYSGHVRTVAAEPGDYNTAMVVLMQ
jgi:hypothetical protein